jgi:hypothetical protein
MVKHSSLFCRSVSDLEKRQTLKGLVGTNYTAYFAATSVTTIRSHCLEGLDVTNTLAYFDKVSMTLKKDKN